MIAGVGGLLLVVLIASLAAWNRSKSSAPPQPVGRYVITVPATQGLTVLNGSASHMLAISPDGKYIAYTAIQNGVVGLYLRSSDNLEPRLVSSPDDAEVEEPFFSPDGHWLGYVSSEGKIKKVSVDGGQPIVVCDVDSRVYRRRDLGLAGQHYFWTIRRWPLASAGIRRNTEATDESGQRASEPILADLSTWI